MPSRIQLMSVTPVLAASFLPVAVAAAAGSTAGPAYTVVAPGLNSPSGISVNPKYNTESNLTPSGEPLPTSDPLSDGLFPTFGRTLLNEGIDFHGLILDQFLANPTTGFRRGNTSNLAGIQPAVDVNLGKLVGIQGGSLHFVWTIWPLRSNYNHFVLDTGGLLEGFQSAPEPVSNELSVLTYEQKLFSDRLSVEFGKTNPYHYFFIPNGLDIFNDIPLTLYVDGDTPPPPHSEWGAVASYHLTPTWFLQGGAFGDDYRRSILDSWNFGTREASGAELLAEIDYRSEFNNARYPANMELGVEYNTRTGSSNVKGTILTYSPEVSSIPYPGGGVVYFQGAKVLWRGATLPHSPPRNIKVYGSFNVAVDKPQPIDLDSTTGVNFSGFLPGRPSDAFGLQAQYLRLSRFEANFETSAETLVGGPGPGQPRNGFGFEVVDQIQLTRWATLSPFVEYFVNPDAFYDPFQGPRQPDGFMAGVYTFISLGPLLGTSMKPF